MRHADSPQGRARRRWRWTPRPILVEHDIAVSDLHPAHHGLRVAHLSDVHAGRFTPIDHIQAAVSLAVGAGADIIALTGDYVSWDRWEVAAMTRALAGLPKGRVFCVLGNHDYFASAGAVERGLRGLGYAVLKNRHVTHAVGGAAIHIIGIDDPVTRHHDLEAAFAGVPDGGTRLVLSHCPTQADALAARGAHLILSGHTHGGQIFVRGITDRALARAGYRYISGHYPVSGSALYVTSGVGFSGVRFRAGPGTRAEVAVLTLRPA
ncbi:MAG TPA: metallophosphoesterase [Kofleriaceae bacterium]|nr:metallophosphoesterase [Kofleriaceae bacterium]